MFKLFTLLVVFSMTVQGQELALPQSLWIDKPMTKADSINILKSGYQAIVVFEQHATAGTDGNDTYDTTRLGQWTVQIRNSKLFCTWSGLYPSCDPITREEFRKNKIIQNLGQAEHRFRLTHFLNKDGVVIKTENKIMSRFESRYEFNKILYTYRDGLLVEAAYFKSNYSPATVPYTRYVFEYSR